MLSFLKFVLKISSKSGPDHIRRHAHLQLTAELFLALYKFLDSLASGQGV